jgi:hypothetical protein
MDQIKIAVTVPLISALALGRSEYGDASVVLSDDDLSSLSTSARALLAAARRADGALLVADDRGYHNRLAVDVADAAHVRLALEAIVEAHERLAAERREAEEREIRSALAAPTDEWLACSGEETYYTSVADTLSLCRSGTVHSAPRLREHFCGLPTALLDDPRLLARREQIARDVLPGLRAAHHARYEEWRRGVEAREAEERARLVAYDAAIVERAASWDDLARSARDGYGVERQVLDRLADELGEAVEARSGCAYLVEGSAWRDPVDRAAPSAEAFRLLDVATEEVRRANASLPAALGAWRVSRIVRVDSCPHDRQHHWITAVLATLETSTGRIREITWSPEPICCDHEEPS